MKARDDLLVQLDELRRRYDARAADYLQRVGTDDEKRVLEAHAREWFIDHLLAAFGWRAGTMSPEFPADGTKNGETRWHMDYFGLAQVDDNVLPLLIVEAKRPEVTLPSLPSGSILPAYYDLRHFFMDGLAGTRPLPTGWQKRLQQCQGYVARVEAQHGSYPHRVMISNGDWFIIFTDPEGSFITKSASVDSILVFADWPNFQKNIGSAVPHIGAANLMDGVVPAGPMSAVEVADLMTRDGGTASAIRGMRLNYTTEEDWDRIGQLPDLKMVPVVLLKSAKGRWAFVEGDATDGPIRVPRGDGRIPGHLEEMTGAAESLEAELAGHISLPSFTSLDAHLNDPLDSAMIPPVRKIGSKAGVSRFLIVTGASTHFLRPEDHRSVECSFHSHEHCPAGQRAPDPGIRSVKSKSYFKTGEPHGCGHLKARELRGTSAGLTDGSVCHIYAFEKSMCCRVCIFEQSCFAHAPLKDHMPCEG